MDDIKKSREEINGIDKQMAELFEKRMSAVKNICEYKMKKGIPVEDKGREAEVVFKNSEYIDDDDIREYYVSFIKDTMAISRAYQHRLMEGLKVAYCGVEGAFAQIAARRIFPDASLVPFGDFQSAYDAVENAECDCAVLPIENSYAGDVGQVIDILFEGSLFINGAYDLGIVHNLLGTPDASIEDVKTVISHPQALSQCHKYIKEHSFKKEAFENTAVAAKTVSDNGDKSIAAIGSAANAQLYGLKILDHDINSSNRNTTRFAVVSRSQNINKNRKSDRFIMMFTVSDETGSLSGAVNVISESGFNMSVLRSRPIRDLSWQYYFFVEAIGDVHSIKGQIMLKELEKCCNKIKVIGSFKEVRELSE